MSELAAAAPTSPPAHPADPVLKRHVTAAVVGNAFEFYDFTTNAFIATQIGNVFFPGNSPFFGLIRALITFDVGFATRPLGALVIGRRAGRSRRLVPLPRKRPRPTFPDTLMRLPCS